MLTQGLLEYFAVLREHQRLVEAREQRFDPMRGPLVAGYQRDVGVVGATSSYLPSMPARPAVKMATNMRYELPYGVGLAVLNAHRRLPARTVGGHADEVGPLFLRG